LVEGDLMTYIQPDIASATPEQQISAIQQMVADGVDGLIVHPLNAQAQASAIDAAGEAGVPVVIQTDAVPNSKYAINNHAMVNISGEAAFLKSLYDDGWFRGEKRTTVYIRGIEGNSLEQAIHEATVATDAACPGIEALGTLFTNWDNTTTKEQLLTFLASHPETIDFMPGEAGVTQGMIQAFEAAGRTVPPIAFNQSFGGDYSWWLANKDSYTTVGHSFDGGMALYSEFRILLRILGGNMPKVNSIPLNGVVVTNDNLDQYAIPGLDVSEPGSLVGPPDAALSNSQLDAFFVKPGTPGGL
jgi:ABC-type sugar transport system substrate-binding protein